MNFVLGILAITFTVKGLGGSFHLLLEQWGCIAYRGPLIGGMIGLFMMGYFLSYGREDRFPTLKTQRVKGQSLTWFLFAFTLLVTAALWVRIDHLRNHPIDIHQADMLPLVRAGLQEILSGHQPYHAYTLSEGHIAPGYYLPGLWIFYLPFEALGLDIRFANVLSHLVLYVVILFLFLRRERFEFSFGRASAVLFGLIALHAFSKQSVGYTGIAHTAGFEILLVLFAWGVVERRHRFLRGVVPLLILSREIGILFVLPYAFWVFRQDRREFFRSAAWTAVIGLAITVPFIIASPFHFFDGLRYYTSVSGETSWETMVQYFGLCGPLKKMGLAWLASLFQISGLVGSLILLSRTQMTREQALALGGVTFLTFILFVGTTWNYLFEQPLSLIYLLWAARKR